MVLIVVTIVMLLLAAIFVHSMFYGAPFLPAKQQYVEKALNLLDLRPGQKLLELGSGDGRVLIAAAKRGIYVTGYEINPLLYAYSWLRARRYRRHITVIRANYWNQPFPEADGIYTYLLRPYVAKLDHKLQTEVTKPTKLLSFIFRIEGKKPSQQSEGMYLYQY